VRRCGIFDVRGDAWVRRGTWRPSGRGESLERARSSTRSRRPTWRVSWVCRGRRRARGRGNAPSSMARVASARRKRWAGPSGWKHEPCESSSRLLVAGALRAGFPAELSTVKRLRAVVAPGGSAWSTGRAAAGSRCAVRASRPPKAREPRQPGRRGRDPGVKAQEVAWAQEGARREGRAIVTMDAPGFCRRSARHPDLGAPRPDPRHPAQLHVQADVDDCRALSWWRFCLRFHDGATRAAQGAEFLGALKRQFRRELLVISDGVATHSSRLVRGGFAQQDGHIAVAALPPYGCPSSTRWSPSGPT
jgi:hypothetical protein